MTDTTADTTFETLETSLATGGEALLERLISQLREERRYHELFDARLLESRQRLGLPIVLTGPLDDMPEPVRASVEAAYLDACREVGSLLLASGDLRSAWTSTCDRWETSRWWPLV